MAFFSHQLSEEVASIPERPFDEPSLAVLESYAWPGNVRELKFAVERALCVAREDRVTVSDLPPEIVGESGSALIGRARLPGTFDEQMAAVERGLLLAALERSGHSQKDAAASLDLTYDRFRHLLRKHGLTRA